MDRNRPGESRLGELTASNAEITDLPLAGDAGQRMEVNVLFTTHAGTLAALKIGVRLGSDLHTQPRVLLLYEVPYTLPIAKPAVPNGLLEHRIRELARESATEITARIILCREARRTLRQILRPHSLVVIGGKRRWWPTKEQRWARLLRREGHEVIFADSE